MTPSEWFIQQHEVVTGDTLELTEGQQRCLDVIGSTDQLYNLNIVGRNDRTKNYGFKFTGDRLDVSYLGSMSTFDCPRLTEIVKAAHHHRVRVEFAPAMVMLPIDEAVDPVMEDGCDHSEWGWGSCDCTVYPQAVLNIGLNAREPQRDRLEGIQRTWAWHPGPERLAPPPTTHPDTETLDRILEHCPQCNGTQYGPLIWDGNPEHEPEPTQCNCVEETIAHLARLHEPVQPTTGEPF